MEDKIYQQENLGEAPKNFDCMCNKCGGKCCTGQCSKQEVSEWPQVGDDAELRYKFDSKQIMHSGKLLYLSDNHIIIATDKNSDYHCHRCDWSIEKPKTPEEELRDEVTEVVWKANDLWTSTKEVQQVSVQEFVATKIIDKYNITKKV